MTRMVTMAMMVVRRMTRGWEMARTNGDKGGEEGTAAGVCPSLKSRLMGGSNVKNLEKYINKYMQLNKPHM